MSPLDQFINLDLKDINNLEYKIIIIFDRILIFSNKNRPLYQKSHLVCLKIFDTQ